MSEWLKKVNDKRVMVKDLTLPQQQELCAEIRDKMMEVVSKNGGHLASNLGTTELTVALYSVFDIPEDTLIFDVGHQSYAHKLLSGRLDDFDSLRKENGISGFPKPSESIYDSFIEGHASTSISQAVGLSYAKLLNNEDSMTIAIIGDGALTGGLAYEAMNNISNKHKNLIVVLNDNDMSISKSVGALNRYLVKIRNNSMYISLKNGVLSFLKIIPGLGSLITRWIVNFKSHLRRNLFGGTLFEELGFNYVGPIDGHDLDDMEDIFRQLDSSRRGPYLVHVITQKGKGYTPAEENPGAFHGVSSFEIERTNPDMTTSDSFSSTFGRKLTDMATFDERICAVTAAMKYGTGLQYFAHAFPDRFFDVGIAEQHAVTMCSGLSKGGMKPYFCVYSTFMQRCVDQLIHDISLDDLDFVLGIDRAGFVGDDGETHQGLYDVPYLSSIGTFTIFSPSNYSELMGCLDRSARIRGPVAIRYPRGKEDEKAAAFAYTGNDQDLISDGEKNDTLIITYGREFANVLGAKQLLQCDGISTDILKLNKIFPVSDETVKIAKEYRNVLFVEESLRTGGIGEQLLDKLQVEGFGGRYGISAIESSVIRQASVQRQLEMSGLDSTSIYKKVKEVLF